MKLAQSWTEDAPSLVTAAAFHDEVKEVDEVDEPKDGCGGVEWHKYVLTKPHTSNKLLHELAREIRGLEKRGGRKLNAVQYISVYDKWEAASRPFLRPGHDYFTELLAKLDCVTVPKGETLVAAFERAKTKSPPAKAMISANGDLRLLASLCRELQELAGDQPIMLCQMSVAKLFGHSSHRNVSNWIRALKILNVLRVAAPWGWRKAARYFYVP
jgi:hypothetical protein